MSWRKAIWRVKLRGRDVWRRKLNEFCEEDVLSAYNLLNNQQNTNDFDQSEITYLFNDNNILSPISYKIYYSDIWNNFEFLYNSNFFK